MAIKEETNEFSQGNEGNSHSTNNNNNSNNSNSNNNADVSAPVDDDDDDDGTSQGKTQKERRKIEIKFIQEKSRRHITFSKRKAGIMKKAYELSVLTGTQVLLLVVSETGLVYTFTTPKLQPLVTKSEGKNLIQACLNAPEEGLGDDQENQSDGNTGDSPDQSPAPATNPNVMGAAGHAHHIQQQQQQQQQQQAQQQAQQQMAPMPSHGLPTHYSNPQGAGNPGVPPQQQGQHQPGIPLQGGYSDQYLYFGNIQNNNIPNQQQYQ